MATAAGTAAIFNTFSRASRLSISRRRFNCTWRSSWRISRTRARNLAISACCSATKRQHSWHVPCSVTPASFSQRLRVPSQGCVLSRDIYLPLRSGCSEPVRTDAPTSPARKFIRELVPDRLSAAFTMKSALLAVGTTTCCPNRSCVCTQNRSAMKSVSRPR